jgi:anti-anti-sigma factor
MNSIINVESIGEVLVLKTQGYLNKDLGEEILEVSKDNIARGTTKIVINLELSNIVNSIGASIMIELIEELQEVEGRLAFCALTPIVEKTFNIMGLTKYCETFESQGLAIQGMS